jgi:hypothetical protein
MNAPLALFVGAASLLAFSSAHAALITDFGSASFSPSYTDFASSDQTSSQITLEGTQGSLIFGDLSTPFSILPSTTSLTFSGIYTGSYTEGFFVELLDADGDTLAYSGYYSDFTPGVLSTVTLTFTGETGSFDGIVTAVGFTAGPAIGSASVDLVASNLSTVPEPSALALASLTLAIALTTRRRGSR